MSKNKCPNCGCDEFVSEPNQYDIMLFNGKEFEIHSSELMYDDGKVFCRDCSALVGVNETNEIVLIEESDS